MKIINICYIINQKYLPLTLTSIDYIRRFFKASDRYKLRFIVFGVDKLSHKDAAPDIELFDSPFGDMPICHQRARIFEILDVDKFIFLDSDTVFTTCISKLWEKNIEDNVIGAVQHYYFPTFGDMEKLYGIGPFLGFGARKFFNCGVLLVDLKKWRSQNITAKYFRQIKTYEDSLHKNKDEPAMNLVLWDNWKDLGEKWNYLPRGGFKKSCVIHYYGDYVGQKPRHDMFKA